MNPFRCSFNQWRRSALRILGEGAHSPSSIGQFSNLKDCLHNLQPTQNILSGPGSRGHCRSTSPTLALLLMLASPLIPICPCCPCTASLLISCGPLSQSFTQYMYWFNLFTSFRDVRNRKLIYYALYRSKYII